MTALELWTCAAILVAAVVWALWPDIVRWLHTRGDRRPGYIYDQERER